MVKQNTILPDFFKAIGFNVDKKDFVLNWGYFMFYGMLAGIALNDIWRILHLPGEDLPILFGGQAQSIEIDYVYQLAIAGLIVLSQAFGVKYASGFGLGMALGSTMANQTESGQTLTLLPFNMPSKH